MKPHRRKNTPPRRESGGEETPAPQEPTSAPESHPTEPAVQPEQPYVDPAAQGYDPGQALADPGEAYQQPQTPDPGQVYIDPATGYPAPPPAQSPPPPAEGAGVYDEIAPPPAPAPAPAPAASPAPRRSPAPARRPASGGARRSPQRRPSTTGSRRRPSTGYRPPKSYGGGVSMMTVFLGLLAIGLLALIAMIGLPSETLPKVEGYTNSLSGTVPAQNLLDRAQKVMIDRTTDLTLTEQEVNAYLGDRLEGAQDGLISSVVKFRGVFVDFSPGSAEIFVEREVFGQPITMSSRVTAEDFRGKTVFRSGGWSIGRISFSSRNIKPIIDMFGRLRETCQDEMMVLNNMVGVRFEENQIVLDSTL